MPKRKQPSTLKYLCLENIAENIQRHGLVHWLTKSEITLYSPLKTHFSDKLLEIFLQKQRNVCVGKSWVSPLFVFCVGMLMENEFALSCLELIFNSYKTTSFPALGGEKYQYGVPIELLLKLLYNCKNITSLDLKCCNAVQGILFEPVIAHSLRNVSRLVMTSTTTGDEIFLSLMKNCPLLTHLELNYTYITDEGIKMLCGNYSHSKENGIGFNGLCKNSMNCCVMPKLKYFNIDGTSVSHTGIIWILQHFPSLQIIKHKILTYFEGGSVFPQIYIERIAIPEALVLLQQQVGTSCVINLEKLHFLYEQNMKHNLKKILLLCPRLKTLNFNNPLDNLHFLLIASLEYLTDVTFSIGHSGIYQSTEFQSFLLLKGHKLTSFKLKGIAFIEIYSLFDILLHCPNLHQLHFKEFKLLPPEDNKRSHRSRVEKFKASVSLNKLETFTVSAIRENQSALSELVSSIISVSLNIIHLKILDSRVGDNAFFPVQTSKALNNLRVLVLYKCKITERLLSLFIKNDNELSILRISCCERITSAIMKKIQKYVAKRNISIDISESLEYTF